MREVFSGMGAAFMGVNSPVWAVCILTAIGCVSFQRFGIPSAFTAMAGFDTLDVLLYEGSLLT
jgi:hypothetical protein